MEVVRAAYDAWNRGDMEAVREMYNAGDQVVVGIRLSGRGKASGVEVEMPRWNVYGIRNGLVIRVEIFETEAEAFDAAGLSE